MACIWRSWHFNPRSLAGATVGANDLMVMCKFQSTLPRGSDHGEEYFKDHLKRFQSTLPRGSDSLTRSLTAAGFQFQSTLPRGSDASPGGGCFFLQSFQSTLPRGSDEDDIPSGVVRDLISIHAPSRERLLGGQYFNNWSEFQSTLPRGSDRN